MHQTPAGTLGVRELYVLGATLECGFSSRWGSCSLGATARCLSPAPGRLVQAPGVLGQVWAGPQGRELRLSCRGRLHLGHRTWCLADPGSHVSRRGRLCGADWGGSGVLGRRWTLGSSCSGCSDSFSALALQRDTKGGHAWQVVVDGQQWAVSGQEGWSHEEELALRSVL